MESGTELVLLGEGIQTFCDSSWAEGLGFNLYVAPAGSLSPSISYGLSVGLLGVSEGEDGHDLSQYQN